jgi:hypothetical protein
MKTSNNFRISHKTNTQGYNGISFYERYNKVANWYSDNGRPNNNPVKFYYDLENHVYYKNWDGGPYVKDGFGIGNLPSDNYYFNGLIDRLEDWRSGKLTNFDLVESNKDQNVYLSKSEMIINETKETVKSKLTITKDGCTYEQGKPEYNGYAFWDYTFGGAEERSIPEWVIKEGTDNALPGYQNITLPTQKPTNFDNLSTIIKGDNGFTSEVVKSLADYVESKRLKVEPVKGKVKGEESLKQDML